MAKEIYVLNTEKDNTGTVISRNMTTGRIIQLELSEGKISIEIQKDIPFGHKIAIRPIKKGDVIYKYGLSIGTAIQDIQVGDHVHVHNIESNRGRGDLFSKQEEAIVK